VWVFSPSHYRYTTKYLGLKNVFLVPMWNFLDLTNEFDQKMIASTCSVPVVKIMTLAQVGPEKKGILEKCNFVSAGCTGGEIADKTLPICNNHPKVLFFGAIAGSDSDRRMRMCVEMKQQFRNNFDCYEAVFGASLVSLVNSASIIVLDRFYNSSTLETHRIDPLLMKGKVVVSTRSMGKFVICCFSYCSVLINEIKCTL
jgi:hypothetical protein